MQGARLEFELNFSSHCASTCYHFQDIITKSSYLAGAQYYFILQMPIPPSYNLSLKVDIGERVPLKLALKNEMNTSNYLCGQVINIQPDLAGFLAALRTFLGTTRQMQIAVENTDSDMTFSRA